MGSYIYGHTTKSKSLPFDDESGDIEVGVVKYICKPGWDGNMPPQANRTLSRYHTLNENRPLHRYVVIDKIEHGTPIHDLALRKGQMEYPVHATFYDDPYGFGPVVGRVMKSGRKYIAQMLTSEQARELMDRGEL